MCGIAGYIGRKADLSTAKRLLLAAEVRGHDATGYLEVQNGSYTMRKQAVPASQFIESLKFQFKGENHTFLGHTRYATQGDAGSTIQAHPFIGSRFVLFHNGVIQDYDQKRLAEKFGIAAQNGVDSELFLAFLEKTGSIPEFRDRFLTELTGGSAYALVIFDKESKSIHFMRDEGRPICVSKAALGGLFYASTPAILQAVIGKKQLCEMLQPYTHLEISSFSGEILGKCAIGRARASVGIDAAQDYMNKYRRPIKFF